MAAAASAGTDASTVGKVIKCKAAVAWEAKKPLGEWSRLRDQNRLQNRCPEYSIPIAHMLCP